MLNISRNNQEVDVMTYSCFDNAVYHYQWLSINHWDNAFQ